MIKALVFDVYGTLLDTRSCSLVIMKDVLKGCNCTLNEEFVYGEWRKDIEKMILEMGDESKFKTEQVFFAEALERTLKRLKVNADENEKMKLYSGLCWGKRGIFPETIEALSELSENYKIIVASNSDTEPLIKDFERHEVIVDKLLSSEILRFYKPHKGFYIKMLENIKLSKDEIIYIGDSLENDVKGPRNVGIKSVWVDRKNKDNEDVKVDFVVKDLNEINDLRF